MKFVNVVIENRSRHTDALFTYRAPGEVRKGAVVYVPFAKGDRVRRAFVFEDDVTTDLAPEKIKDIAEVDPRVSLTGEMVETCRWMRQRYGIRYIDAIRCFIPPGKPAREGKEKRPLRDSAAEAQEIEHLTAEQQAACDRITAALKDREQKNFLIHGVTGSGKTEVYMQACAAALAEGRRAIMLVPEIALTKQITERFIGRFGRENIAILHSKLTGRERFDEWMRIREGEARIVIGARMGVFAPVEELGLVIMDEEHESTYKSDMNPKYETVDIALKRLMQSDGVLLMGSATPSVVSYQRAKDGIYELIELKERYNKTPLPKVEIIDQRQELRKGNRGLFSDELYRRMEETLAKKQQVILFLNRRGYSTYMACRECGAALICPDCGISLTYHKTENAGICHYCGRRFPVPEVCPDCGSPFIRFVGAGTEQVEEYAASLFPEAQVDRLDLDTAKNGREIRKILNAFSQGKTDILVGTQLVAKGLDFRNVGLVGVVSADTTLNIPDYRSSERTFQLVTQVAGRAGRGTEEGLVVVQTCDPENFAIRAAAAHDYRAFFDREIRFRQMMGYPPFTDIILVQFTAEREEVALQWASECGRYLAGLRFSGAAGEIFEPKIAEHFKGEGHSNFRYNVMIKSPKGLRNQYIFYTRKFGERLLADPQTCSMVIDVNPYSTF